MDLWGRWWMADVAADATSSRGLLSTGDWGTWRACSGRGRGAAAEVWLRSSRLRVFLPPAPAAAEAAAAAAAEAAVAAVELAMYFVRLASITASSRSVSSRPTGRSWAACIARAFAISIAAGLPRSVAARRRDADADADARVVAPRAATRGGCGGRGGLLDTGALPLLLQETDTLQGGRLDGIAWRLQRGRKVGR